MSASLTDLKKKTATELTEIGRSLELDGLGRMRKQDQIFTILKSLAKRGEELKAKVLLKFYKMDLVS